ncbi:MAG: hypothetical protein WKF37_11685 [Bryobacteraceae bacterium]
MQSVPVPVAGKPETTLGIEAPNMAVVRASAVIAIASRPASVLKASEAQEQVDGGGAWLSVRQIADPKRIAEPNRCQTPRFLIVKAGKGLDVAVTLPRRYQADSIRQVCVAQFMAEKRGRVVQHARLGIVDVVPGDS